YSIQISNSELSNALKVTVLGGGKKETCYNYGDIIGFQREKLPGGNIRFKFMHFGIYIDKLRFEEYGQKEGDNLFHITGPIYYDNGIFQKFSGCVFGKIENEIKNENKITEKKFNYLDGLPTTIKNVMAGPEDKFTERILSKLPKCQNWDALQNNCEHLATYIRYGVSISLQQHNALQSILQKLLLRPTPFEQNFNCSHKQIN
uniref:LRAT domain-containing protein n=1 Tax=Neogobius melanostomus TaxID=47308 RepID=A0A8C6SNK1_9GOBI